MGLLILGIILGVLLCAALCGRRRPGLEGDPIRQPKPPTRVVRPGDPGGYTPNVPPVDWAKVDRRGMRSGVLPPPPAWVRGGHQPNVPPVDWAKTPPPPTGSAMKPPRER
jgi:hypothetical protein